MQKPSDGIYVDKGFFIISTCQIDTDQEYWQKVIQASDFIMQGTVCDTVMRAI
jgi:hypothetical protein